jgi:predicted metal-dependent phosphoesterase TrpH
VHTKYSGVHRLGVLRFPESVSDPADVVKKARSVGMNVVCITDHNSILGAKKAREAGKGIDGIEVVIGEEISTADGEVIGLFIEEEIPAGLSAVETIDRIREQGGLVIAPHPFSLHCPCLREKIEVLDIDGIETLNGGHIDDYANAQAQERGKTGRFACLGSSDAHYLKTIGCAYTEFEGTTAEELRKAIVSKTTSAGGKPMPLDKAIAWSIGIIIESDRLILRSFVGLDKEPTDDPILWRVQNMKLGQKLGALVGSLVYLLPPVPFIIGIYSQRLLHNTADDARTNGGLSKLDGLF